MISEQKRKEYYDNPSYCKYCGKIIKIKNEQRIREVKRKKFCGLSCSASFNNKGVIHNKTGMYQSYIKDLSDQDLVNYFNSSSSCKEFYKKLGYSNGPRVDSRKIIVNRLSNLGLNLKSLIKTKEQKIVNFVNLEDRTKIDLFSTRKNWQSARTSIRKHADKIHSTYWNSTFCHICGYNKHIEICHIKSVSDFSNESTIKEINDPYNLVGLCPNCHYEFDNGLMSQENINKILDRK